MSDEEKKAIEVLQYVKNKTPFIFWYEDKPYNRKETINTILNLIKKQSKEIEELKRKGQLIKTYKGNLPENVEIICLCKNDFERNISDDYISKDKIKAKIEELKAKIEELKANKGYHLGFIDGGIAKRYEYEDKIKSKIDYLLKHYDSENFINFEMFIKILQSLLEKE